MGHDDVGARSPVKPRFGSGLARCLRSDAQEGTPVMSVAAESTSLDVGVRPFRAEVPEEAVFDLRGRTAAGRPPEHEPVEDQSQGVQLETVRQLAAYWATEYDWRQCEERLNSLPQFMTQIDGLDFHFIHVRSPH